MPHKNPLQKTRAFHDKTHKCCLKYHFRCFGKGPRLARFMCRPCFYWRREKGTAHRPSNPASSFHASPLGVALAYVVERGGKLRTVFLPAADRFEEQLIAPRRPQRVLLKTCVLIDR